MAAAWLVEFSQTAETDLARLDAPVRRRIIDKLEWLEANFDSVVPLVLGGEFRELFKLRVGDWRVIYGVDWESTRITVYYIDRRDRVYKRKK